MKSDVAFLILGGLAALAVMRWGERMPADLVAGTDAPDVWVTPYYLRYNVTVPRDAVPILPQGSPYTFGLGVPAVPTGQRIVSTGGYN